MLILSETMVLWFHFVTQRAKIDRCHVRLKKSFMLASWCSAFFRFTWELSIQCQQCRTISLFLILECRIFILMQSHRDLLHQEVRCQSLERYVLRGFSRRSQYWMGQSSRVWGPRGILINHIIFKIFTVSHLQLKYLTKVSCKLASGETWTMWGIIAGFKLQISSSSWLEEIGELLEC